MPIARSPVVRCGTERGAKQSNTPLRRTQRAMPRRFRCHVTFNAEGDPVVAVTSVVLHTWTSRCVDCEPCLHTTNCAAPIRQRRAGRSVNHAALRTGQAFCLAMGAKIGTCFRGAACVGNPVILRLVDRGIVTDPSFCSHAIVARRMLSRVASPPSRVG